MGKEARPKKRLTPEQLQKIRDSAPRRNRLLKRLCEELLQWWSECEPTNEIPIPEGNPEDAYAAREKVLVVIEPDGFVSVFAERWIDVEVVEVAPWEEVDEATERVGQAYRRLHWPQKLRATGYPKYVTKPNQGGAQPLAELVERVARGALAVRLMQALKGVREGQADPRPEAEAAVGERA